MPLKHFDGGQATGGAADAMVSSQSGTASFDMSMEDAAEVSLPDAYDSQRLSALSLSRLICHNLIKIYDKLTAVSSKQKTLFPTVYFIGKYILVLDRDTFRLEVDYGQSQSRSRLIKTQAREWR